MACGVGKSRTTSSLKKHLEGKHPTQFRLAYPDDRYATHALSDGEDDNSAISPKKMRLMQKRLKETLESKNKWKIDDARSQSLHYAIGEMIAVDVLPYSFVEKVGFRRLLAAMKPQYTVCGIHLSNTPACLIKNY